MPRRKKIKRPAKLPKENSRRKDGQQMKRKAVLSALARRLGGKQKAKGFVQQIAEFMWYRIEQFRRWVLAHPV
jgi:hypothetical protein